MISFLKRIYKAFFGKKETETPQVDPRYNDQTENLTKIIEGAEALGWKVAVMVDEKFEPEAIFAGSTKDVMNFKSIMEFNSTDETNGATH